jgi:mRNA interferase MazF
MAKVKYIPIRGDIVWLDFDPIKGHEQGGTRPAIIISPHNYNQLTGCSIVCPISSKIKKYPFEVIFQGTTIQGAILSDQVRTIDFSKRNISFIEKASVLTIDTVEAKLLTLIKG